jgi:hypothetical protein
MARECLSKALAPVVQCRWQLRACAGSLGGSPSVGEFSDDDGRERRQRQRARPTSGNKGGPASPVLLARWIVWPGPALRPRMRHTGGGRAVGLVVVGVFVRLRQEASSCGVAASVGPSFSSTISRLENDRRFRR